MDRILATWIRRPKLASILFFGCTLVVTAQARADQDTRLYLRTAMASGSFAGADPTNSGSFSVMPALDIEFERFKTNTKSFIFRTTIAYGTATGVMSYLYTGVGERYYLSGTKKTERAEEGFSISSSSKMQYYLGWDAGLATANVKQVSSVLAVTSTLMDFGASLGMNYGITESISLNLGGTMSYGYGFSGLAVTGLVMRFYGGVCF